jgi:hypothetical protein
MEEKMKNSKRILAILSFLIIFSLSCNLFAGFGGKKPDDTADSSQNSGNDQSTGEGQPGDTLYFTALPVDVTDSTGSLKVIAARALQGMSKWNIVAVLKNTSTDPLMIYESLDWQVKVYDAAGKIIGQQPTTTQEMGFPPNHKYVLVAWPGSWEGDAARFGLEIVSAKPRFIQDDMQAKFRALQLSYPMFTIDAQPFTLINDTLFERKVIRTEANAVIRNPNPGPAKEIFSTAVYYDANGQIVGHAEAMVFDVPAGGQVSVTYSGFPYYAGDPVQAEYYPSMDPYYLEELFKMW